MADVFHIADILVSHAVREFGDDIAIIAYYGSRAKGTASPISDLDLFYIPDKGTARSLSSQFVIDGLPYDLWPVSWQMAEDIANARSARPWAVSASLIANTKVIYHRSPADLMRFNALKTRIEALTKPENRAMMIGRALEEYQTTLFHLSQIRLAAREDDVVGVQWACVQFVGSVVNALALVNQLYFSKGWGADVSQLLELPNRPKDLLELVPGIVQAREISAKLALADRLAAGVRPILLNAQASVAVREPAQKVFDSFYYYVCEYTNKVVAACDRGDAMAAAFAAFHMQEQICQLMNKVDKGFWPTGVNLFGEYVDGYLDAGFPDLFGPASRSDLEELRRRVQLLDAKIRQWFEQNSVDLAIFANSDELTEFLAKKAQGGELHTGG